MIIELHYLQNEYLSGSLVDIKLGLVRPVGINPLPCQEVHDVLRPVLVSVRGRDLHNTGGRINVTSLIKYQIYAVCCE